MLEPIPHLRQGNRRKVGADMSALTLERLALAEVMVHQDAQALAVHPARDVQTAGDVECTESRPFQHVLILAYRRPPATYGGTT